MSRVLGGILLFAGNCIGAGMLALPILTGQAGYFPSLAMFIAVWMFMTYTGLLLAEVNLWCGGDVSILSMAGHTLGRFGRGITWVAYLFLFYSLTVAFVSLTGEICTGFIASRIGIELPYWLVSMVAILFFGAIIFLGTSAVDRSNRLFMVGFIGAYVALVVFGVPHVDLSLLGHTSWMQAPWTVPVIITAFGFHNIIPTLSTYLDGNVKKLRFVIIAGSIIPLALYLLWEGIVLGIVPSGDLAAALRNGYSVAHVIQDIAGGSSVTWAVQLLAFFAIATTLLGVGISFVDFLADGLHIKKDRRGRIILCGLVLALPYVLAISYPAVFFKALNYAGGYGAIILFGVMPVAMVWAGQRKGLTLENPLPAKKGLLVVVTLFAVAVMAFETAQELGISPLPIDAETLPGVELEGDGYADMF